MIPKIIHNVWVSGPFKYKDYRFSWLWHNPDYSMMFHRPESLVKCIKCPETIRILYDDSVFWLLKMEIMKWYCLYEFGGIYADTDMECLKNFDGMLNVASFAGIESPDGNIGNALMGACQHDKNVYNIYRYIVNAIVDDLALCNKRPVRMCGERAAFIQACMQQFEKIYQRAVFYPFDIVELDKRDNDFPDAYTKHHWTGKSEGGWIEQAEKFLQNKKDTI